MRSSEPGEAIKQRTFQRTPDFVKRLLTDVFKNSFFLKYLFAKDPRKECSTLSIQLFHVSMAPDSNCLDQRQ